MRPATGIPVHRRATLEMVTAVPSTPKILPTSEASGPLGDDGDGAHRHQQEEDQATPHPQWAKKTMN